MNQYNTTQQVEIIKRDLVELVSERELYYKLENKGQQLVIKLGFDPTTPNLHLGHLIPIRKLKTFQELGYSVVLLIGDFTARVGDPSGTSKLRNKLSEQAVQHNLVDYTKYFFKIIDPDKTKLVYNSQWLKHLDLEEITTLFSFENINTLIKRKGVSQRLEDGKPVSMLEFMYPFLQAYDSVMLKADIEVGGEDQYFNFVFTRTIQQKYSQEPEVIMTLPLLRGTDGKKMSSSANNTINLNQSSRNMFGQLMSINDSLIFDYLKLLSTIPREEINELEPKVLSSTINPRDVKMRLAKNIVSQIFGEDVAINEEKEFNQVYSMRGTPSLMPEIVLDKDHRIMTLPDMLLYSGFAKTKSEAKRLIIQGGVSLNNTVILNIKEAFEFKNQDIIRVGKIRFKRITTE